MRPLYRTLPSLLLVLFLAACGGGRSAAEQAPRTSRDLITQEQLRAAGYANVYDAVRALRANWLQPRGIDSFESPGQVQVYQDGVRVGGIDTLRSIGTLGVTYVRYYAGVEASSRWGLDHGHGVIFVSTEPM